MSENNLEENFAKNDQADKDKKKIENMATNWFLIVGGVVVLLIVLSLAYWYWIEGKRKTINSNAKFNTNVKRYLNRGVNKNKAIELAATNRRFNKQLLEQRYAPNFNGNDFRFRS